MLKWQLKKFLTHLATSCIIKNFRHFIDDDVSACDLFHFIDYDLNSKPKKSTKQEKKQLEKLFN